MSMHNLVKVGTVYYTDDSYYSSNPFPLEWIELFKTGKINKIIEQDTFTSGVNIKYVPVISRTLIMTQPLTKRKGTQKIKKPQIEKLKISKFPIKEKKGRRLFRPKSYNFPKLLTLRETVLSLEDKKSDIKCLTTRILSSTTHTSQTELAIKYKKEVMTELKGRRSLSTMNTERELHKTKLRFPKDGQEESTSIMEQYFATSRSGNEKTNSTFGYHTERKKRKVNNYVNY